MPRNIEIKAKVDDLSAVQRTASALALGPPQVIEQVDTFFAVVRGRLKVRAFPDGSGELIAYDRVNERGPKQSTYTRVECRDATALCEALARVLPVRGVVVKHREVFLVGRTRIHLDRVEKLGTFVELEVVLPDGESPDAGRREAQQLLDSLRIREQDLLPDAYIDLLEHDQTSASSTSTTK